ncbi:MAG: hypothetical protein WCQ90_01995 [Deltaproteobacteria bacterium]
MKKYDYFLSYNEEDLRFEFDMLINCRAGIEEYGSGLFLHNLCLEGLLLHTRRLIEAFHLCKLDKKWEKRRGSIANHLSHANPRNRSAARAKMKENPGWDMNEYYDELLKAIRIVADQHKTEYAHYKLLLGMLTDAKRNGSAADTGPSIDIP